MFKKLRTLSIGLLAVVFLTGCNLNPFASIDQSGVGKLMDFAASNGRQVKKDLKLGICGEHAGDPSSIDFCHKLGLDYVSCSPPRVPIARLAAAQAALRND